MILISIANWDDNIILCIAWSVICEVTSILRCTRASRVLYASYWQFVTNLSHIPKHWSEINALHAVHNSLAEKECFTCKCKCLQVLFSAKTRLKCLLWAHSQLPESLKWAILHHYPSNWLARPRLLTCLNKHIRQSAFSSHWNIYHNYRIYSSTKLSRRPGYIWCCNVSYYRHSSVTGWEGPHVDVGNIVRPTSCPHLFRNRGKS